MTLIIKDVFNISMPYLQAVDVQRIENNMLYLLFRFNFLIV